jgi:hypothetical protein
MGFLNLVLAVTTAVTYAEKGTLYDDDKVVVGVDDAQYVRTNEQFRTIRAEGGVVDLLGTSVYVGGTTAHPGMFVIGNLHQMSNYSGYLWMGYDSSIYFQKGVEMAPNEKFDIPEGFETLDVRYSDMMDRKIAGIEDEFMKAGGPSVVSNDFQIMEAEAEQGVLLKWQAASFADVADDNDSAWLWRSPFWLLQGYSRGVWLGDWSKGYSWGLYASTNRTTVLIRDANHGGGTKGEGEAVASIKDISRAMNSDKVTLGSLNTTAKTVMIGTNTLEDVVEGLTPERANEAKALADDWEQGGSNRTARIWFDGENWRIVDEGNNDKEIINFKYVDGVLTQTTNVGGVVFSDLDFYYYTRDAGIVQLGSLTVTNAEEQVHVGKETLKSVILRLSPKTDLSGYLTSQSASDTYLTKTDAETTYVAKTSLDETVKTAVNKYKDLEYDTALEVTWTRVVNDGHIYYIAVTNVNTSVME